MYKDNDSDTMYHFTFMCILSQLFIFHIYINENKLKLG